MSAKRLLLVEDDRALSIGLRDAFALEGLEVTAARDGEKARTLLHAHSFDVVVLDLMLPGRSGLDVLLEMRERGLATPVLILTARGSEADKVLGLELGADDYVTKPFSLKELVARVRALLRREERRGARGTNAGRGGSEIGDGERVGGDGGGATSPFQLGDARVDLAAFEVRRGDAVHALSKKEAAMLELLWSRRGAAVPRDEFLKRVWEGGDHVGTRTIDTHVLNLRQKLEADPARPRVLLTVHGVGYRLVTNP